MTAVGPTMKISFPHLASLSRSKFTIREDIIFQANYGKMFTFSKFMRQATKQNYIPAQSVENFRLQQLGLIWNSVFLRCLTDKIYRWKSLQKFWFWSSLSALQQKNFDKSCENWYRLLKLALLILLTNVGLDTVSFWKSFP